MNTELQSGSHFAVVAKTPGGHLRVAKEGKGIGWPSSKAAARPRLLAWASKVNPDHQGHYEKKTI